MARKLIKPRRPAASNTRVALDTPHVIIGHRAAKSAPQITVTPPEVYMKSDRIPLTGAGGIRQRPKKSGDQAML